MQEKNVSPRGWKTELKWFWAALILSIVLVGLLTKFEFGTIPIAKDPSYHIHSIKAVVYLAALLLTLKNGVLLVDMILKEAPVLGFIFATIVPVLAILCIYLFYARAIITHDQQAVEIARNQMWLLGTAITLLTFVE